MGHVGKSEPFLETSLPSVSSPSVLMEDVGDIIRQQTSNDAVSPRDSSSYYENYHTLDEVSHHISLQNYCFSFNQHFHFNHRKLLKYQNWWKSVKNITIRLIIQW